MSGRSPEAPPAYARPAAPNATLWVVAGVLAFTVIASFALLHLAINGSEPELPAHYHWEGAALDADLARADSARAAGARVSLDFSAGDVLHARLDFTDLAQRAPDQLVLELTHATLPALDRRLRLRRGTAPGEYLAHAAPLPPGRWLVQVGDGARWRLRGRFEAPARLPVVLGR